MDLCVFLYFATVTKLTLLAEIAVSPERVNYAGYNCCEIYCLQGSM